MKTYIVLYRGVNVVGKNPVKMKLLRAMHERLGHRNVQSYLQSGNIIVSTRLSPKTVARKSAAAFADTFGFSPKVLVVDAGRWRKVVEGNPYASAAAADPKTVHACICDGEPNAAALRALLQRTGGTETFSVSNGVVYLHAPDGYGKSKFAAGMEKACGVPMTVRNWRTMESLRSMTGEKS